MGSPEVVGKETVGAFPLSANPALTIPDQLSITITLSEALLSLTKTHKQALIKGDHTPETTTFGTQIQDPRFVRSEYRNRWHIFLPTLVKLQSIERNWAILGDMTVHTD